MKEYRKNEKELIRKVLLCKDKQEDRKLLSETDFLKRMMRAQWDESNNEPKNTLVENRIWQRIILQCHLKQNHPTFNNKIFIKYTAACAAILFVIGAFWYIQSSIENNKTEYKDIFAREHCMVELPDHSKVWMQPGSSLRYATTFNSNRKVWLKGDATFEVTKQTSHPFQVYINKAYVEVKGTIFRVFDRDRGLSQITLFSGKVDFHSPEKGKVITMKPNQSIIYHSKGEIEIKEINGIKWQNGRYKFGDIRMDSLIDMINDLYDIKIELSASVPDHHLFTGVISYDERPSEIAEKICYNMDLKYKREENKLIIYKPRKKN